VAAVDRVPIDAIPILAPVGYLPVRIRLSVPLSDDALYEFCRINRDLRIERTKEGEIVVMSPTGAETGRSSAALTGQLWVWTAADGSGVSFDSSTGFVLPNGAERSPDASWVRRERWEALSPSLRKKFAPICPDFVAELRSPSDALPDLEAKLLEYVDNGAQLGWLVDPIERRVHVYRPALAVQVFADPATLSGEPVLRGFALDLLLVW
jgi:Uma2 family endonuclease